MPTTSTGLPYPALTDTPDVPYWLQQLADSLNTRGVWQAYAPVLGGTGWVIGNGTLTGRYTRIGKTILFRQKLVMGSTTAKGSGQMTLTLPSTTQGEGNWIVRGSYLDASPVARGPLDGLIQSAVNYIAMYTNGMAAAINSTSPITWATSDEIHIGGMYEEA